MKKIIFFTITAYLSVVFLVFYYSQHIQTHIKEKTVSNAIANFELMLDTRSWNSSHGGVYVKQKNGLKPNKYLKNNILLTDKNETLIKINPAWMTRQISKISNKNRKNYFHITSLKPINPNNAPDAFEKEGLKYFEKNSDKKFYSKFNERDDGKVYLDFIGALKTEKACLKCHAIQGYKIGDIRGGIRVSTPMVDFNNDITSHNKIGILVLFLMSFIFVVFIFIVKKYFQELKQKDEMLINQSRHAAMGEMIGMIAHQWRQPLSTISMTANNMLLDISLGELSTTASEEYANSISDQTQHLSQTIDDFRNFFKPDRVISKVNIKHILDQTLSIVKESLSNNTITLTRSFETEQEVNAYPRELMQVFVNIITNAKDALKANTQEHATINIRVYEDKKYINIEICDNGGGIDTDILPKVFDPYFSTKDEKTGKGLGLYMSKMIIENHLNGILEVKNKEYGTCFTVRLVKELAHDQL